MVRVSTSSSATPPPVTSAFRKPSSPSPPAAACKQALDRAPGDAAAAALAIRWSSRSRFGDELLRQPLRQHHPQRDDQAVASLSVACQAASSLALTTPPRIGWGRPAAAQTA